MDGNLHAQMAHAKAGATIWLVFDDQFRASFPYFSMKHIL